MWLLTLEWLVLALLVCWSVGAYRRVQRLRAECVQAFAELAVALHSWRAWWALQVQVRPQAASAAWQRWPAALDALQPASQRAVREMWREGSTAALEMAWREALHAWQADMADAQSCDSDPRAWQHLHSQWREHDMTQRKAALQFQAAAQRYNQAIAQWPAVLLARVRGWTPLRPFLHDAVPLAQPSV